MLYIVIKATMLLSNNKQVWLNAIITVDMKHSWYLSSNNSSNLSTNLTEELFTAQRVLKKFYYIASILLPQVVTKKQTFQIQVKLFWKYNTYEWDDFPSLEKKHSSVSAKTKHLRCDTLPRTEPTPTSGKINT